MRTRVAVRRNEDIRERHRAAPRKASAAWVQPKLEVGRADDPLEREADRTAAIVMQRLSLAGGTGSGDEAATVRRSVQSGVDGGSMGPEGGTVDPVVERAVSTSGGVALDPLSRSTMESAFGADFSSVRIHTGSKADGLNDRLGARAFTTGSNIFVRSGEYTPRTAQGQRLLAHELTHTIQQRGVALRLASVPTIQRKIGHHAEIGDEVYGSDDGQYAGVRGRIVEKELKRRTGFNIPIPRRGGINIPNPLPAPRVLSTQKGHDKVVREVERYTVQTTGPSPGQEYVLPESDLWESVRRDTRKAGEGPTVGDKAAALYTTARSKAKGHGEVYEELSGGGKVAVIRKYGTELATVLGDLAKLIDGRIDSTKRYGAEVASKWKGYAITAADMFTKSLGAVSALIGQLEIPEPTIKAIQSALKVLKKILTRLVTLAKMYQSLSHSDTQGLVTLKQQAMATGYGTKLMSIAGAIADDDELTNKVQGDVPGMLVSIAGMIDQGFDALTSVEASTRRRLGGSAELG